MAAGRPDPSRRPESAEDVAAWADGVLEGARKPRMMWALGGFGLLWAITGFEPFLFFVFGSCALIAGGAFENGWGVDEGLARRRRRGAEGEDEDAHAVAPGGEPAPEAPPRPLHLSIVDAARPARARVEAAAAAADGDLRVALSRMVAATAKVEAGLTRDPARLSDVQRLFTYYLPATADLLAARATTGRAAEIDAMIGRLDLAFADFAERVQGHDDRALAIDLKMLDRALDAEFDLERRRDG